MVATREEGTQRVLHHRGGEGVVRAWGGDDGVLAALGADVDAGDAGAGLRVPADVRIVHTLLRERVEERAAIFVAADAPNQRDVRPHAARCHGLVAALTADERAKLIAEQRFAG